MRNLVEFLTEGNISNVERKYREFSQMCTAYNTNVENIKVCKTSKNNWAVYNENGKKLFLASSNILDQNVIDKYDIKSC